MFVQKCLPKRDLQKILSVCLILCPEQFFLNASHLSQYSSNVSTSRAISSLLAQTIIINKEWTTQGERTTYIIILQLDYLPVLQDFLAFCFYLFPLCLFQMGRQLTWTNMQGHHHTTTSLITYILHFYTNSVNSLIVLYRYTYRSFSFFLPPFSIYNMTCFLH